MFLCVLFSYCTFYGGTAVCSNASRLVDVMCLEHRVAVSFKAYREILLRSSEFRSPACLSACSHTWQLQCCIETAVSHLQRAV